MTRRPTAREALRFPLSAVHRCPSPLMRARSLSSSPAGVASSRRGTSVRGARRRRLAAAIAVTLAIAVLAAPTIASAMESPGAGGMLGELQVDWEQRQRGSGAVIGGYVYNSGGTAAVQVMVLAEGLDGGGQRVSSTFGNVMGTVPAFGRAYFEMRVPSAVSYRVSIQSADWIRGGGGGGGM